jgi:hypothetical protein
MFYTCIFSDHYINALKTNAAINEVYIKEELIDDAMASVSSVQQQMIKREDSIDIKHEPLPTKGGNCSRESIHFSCMVSSFLVPSIANHKFS